MYNIVRVSTNRINTYTILNNIPSHKNRYSECVTFFFSLQLHNNNISVFLFTENRFDSINYYIKYLL